jgi:hypothetical protein
MVAASLLVSAGVATGSGTKKQATLKISGVPASVVRGGSFTINATGYSGKFDTLWFFGNAVGSCKSTASAEALQQHTSYGVTKNHTFSTHAHWYLDHSNNDRPGTYSVCVYLYSSSLGPRGTQLHKSATYQIP